MECHIGPSAYADPVRFQQERTSIFADLWQFVGFTRDLAAPNDYLVVAVGGQSVTIQNFDGVLRAFANVCSHRFTRMRCDSRGNGLLRCPYHGWIYDADGIPYSIPSRPRFDDLTPDVLKSLALEAFDIDVCGMLVFVRRRVAGPSLREFLGAAATTIERMCAGFGPLIDRNEMTIRANWKINVENTLESYHVGFVHPQTFKKVGAKGLDFTFDGLHSSWLAPTDDGVAAQMQKLIAKLGGRAFEVDGYFHQFIFPNLTLATTYGTSFAVQQFFPVSVAETRFTSFVFYSGQSGESGLSGSMAELMHQGVANFNRAVFEEDRQICEQVQLGAAESRQPGRLSDEEARVGHFQAVYVQQLTALQSAGR